MAVEFRLLGDVGVRIDGRDIDVGHARRRCALAVLLVEANRVVPVDRLIHRVWADRPPKRPRIALSSYLSLLRKALAASTDVALARQPGGGYQLTVDPTAVDLHRFHELIAQARTANADEDALLLFDQALGLWRGEAFAMMDTPWFNTIREHLETERMGAELDRTDIALAVGRHAELLGELSLRATRHPMDERVAGQFVLALYRCGRQADALQHFEQVRRRLAEELGADPGPALQMLHRQILTADPALDVRVAAAATRPAAASPVPRQMPPPPGSFVGRAAELARLDTILSTSMSAAAPAAVVIVTVSGAAGVGKTALALHWAHRVADRFADGQLYVNLRGFSPGGSPTSPDEAVRGFLDAFGVTPPRIPDTLSAQVGLYRSLLAGRRMLIMLDNARDADQVRPLLPGTPGCLVVVTSRNQLIGLVANEVAHPLRLDLLAVTEARDLLTGRLGARRVAAEPDAVAEIIARCARLPLALAVVAARAAAHPSFPLAVLAGELRAASKGLDALSGADPITDVRAVFSWSYHALGGAAARLFRLLGLPPGPDITTPAAASLAGVAIEAVRPLLLELAGAHLLIEHAPGRYTLHDLLRAYASEQNTNRDTDTERRAALRRVLDHYLHTAHAAAVLLNRHRKPISIAAADPGATPGSLADAAAAEAWFTAEYPALLEAVRRAADARFDTHAWQLAWALYTVLDRRGYADDHAAVERIALASARRQGDRAGQAHANRGLACAFARLGRYDDAHRHLEESVAHFRELGDEAGLARTHLNAGWLLDRQGRHDEALHSSLKALDLFRATDDPVGQAAALNSVGWTLAHLGDYRWALRHCQQALELQRANSDLEGTAFTLDSLGYVYRHLGNHQQAIDAYEQALCGFRSLGDRWHEAASLSDLGDIRHATGDAEAARDLWREALTILEQLADSDADSVRAKLDRDWTALV